MGECAPLIRRPFMSDRSLGLDLFLDNQKVTARLFINDHDRIKCHHYYHHYLQLYQSYGYFETFN
jgi:hypothetical protein